MYDTIQNYENVLNLKRKLNSITVLQRFVCYSSYLKSALRCAQLGDGRGKENYRTRAIISRGLYIFYPISKDHFFVFKEVFSENSVLMYGLYSRAASNQERLMMARVRYVITDRLKTDT